jgi:GntR family transcriptional repressor for pyruvate dehydrogenase complex
MGTHSRDTTLVRVTKQLEAHLLELASHRGSRLPSERTMAARFGASRSTVREAIQRLIARGLLTAKPGSGVFVTGSHPIEPASSWLQLIDEHPRLRG